MVPFVQSSPEIPTILSVIQDMPGDQEFKAILVIHLKLEIWITG